MQQKDPYTYIVTQGEEVTFEITPMNGAVGERVTAAQGDEEIPNSGSDACPVFSFTANGDPGHIHVTVLIFSFVDGDPADAYYEVQVKGSENGAFESDSVWKEDGDDQESQYTFKVS